MSDDKLHFQLDLTEQDPDLPDACPDFCPKCRVPAEQGFGLAGGGYGAYSYCPKCGEMLGKVQVND